MRSAGLQQKEMFNLLLHTWDFMSEMCGHVFDLENIT